MNVKLLAALDTLKLVVAMMAGAGLTHIALTVLSPQTIMIVLGVGLTALILYIFYSLNLARRSYERIKDNKET